MCYLCAVFHRHAWLCLIGAGCPLGCGSGAAENSRPETVASSPPSSPLSFDPIAADPNASVPRTLVMRIAAQQDVYRVRVQAYVQSPDNPASQTRCQEADLWRVGPHAVDWPASSAFVLPLDYVNSLPDGVYVEQIRGRVFSYGRGLRISGSVQASTRVFEVIQGALRPITVPVSFFRDRLPKDEYGNVIPTPSAAPPPNPCIDSTPVDDTPLEGATTIVDFDTWESAGSLQPLRLNVGSKTLSYQTTSSADLALQFEIAVPSNITSGEEHVALGEASRLSLSPPSRGSRDEVWVATSGSALIRSLGDGRLSVELSDIILENEFDATLRRPIAPGSIVGDWVERP
jgi:hypothetical protein